MPVIQCDTTQVTQALINIVLNALQAMPDGGICRISVGKDVQPDESWIEVSVQDSGYGIQSKDYSRLFDPFFTTKPNGSGLGLAIAHQILTNHGGRIDIVSNRDSGTTVSLRLPVHARHSSIAVGKP